MNIIFSYFGGLLTLLILDALMIGGVILPMFKKYIGDQINETPNLIAGGLFYLLYIAVLLILIILPGLEQKVSYSKMIFSAGLFGFGAYMTYELTSMTVMKNWSWYMVGVDVTWGTVLTILIACCMYFIIQK